MVRIDIPGKNWCNTWVHSFSSYRLTTPRQIILGGSKLTSTFPQLNFLLDLHIQLQIRFPRDADGKYSPVSPTNQTLIYSDKLAAPTFKYAQQGRFCLGVASVELMDGTITGRKKVYDYTGQRLVSVKEYEVLIKKECRRIKNLKKCDWRPNDSGYCEEDSS